MACFVLFTLAAVCIWINSIQVDARKKLQAEIARKKLQDEYRKIEEHKLWLLTEEGIAHENAVLEKLEAEKEAQVRLRRIAEEPIALIRWRLHYESATIEEISNMTGRQFEQFLARLLGAMGYVKITLTPINDQGGDIVCISSSNVRVVVQAKRWKATVGNKAVQELLGALLHYDCQEGMVITNSVFTIAAGELAEKDPRITLYDGNWLAEMISLYLPVEIPEFDWDVYNRLVKTAALPCMRGSQPRSGQSLRNVKKYKYRRKYRRYW